MAERRPGPGRPSKGERWPVHTRLPQHVADLFKAEADRRDVAYSELLASLAAAHYGVPLKPTGREDDEGLLLTA